MRRTTSIMQLGGTGGLYIFVIWVPVACGGVACRAYGDVSQAAKHPFLFQASKFSAMAPEKKNAEKGLVQQAKTLVGTGDSSG